MDVIEYARKSKALRAEQETDNLKQIIDRSSPSKFHAKEAVALWRIIIVSNSFRTCRNFLFILSYLQKCIQLSRTKNFLLKNYFQRLNSSKKNLIYR